MHRGEVKVVVITGASSGIGQATAKLFAKAGYRIGTTFLSRINEIKETETACRKLGAPDFFAVQLDMAEAASITETAQALYHHFHTVDVLINNAGVAIDKELTEQTSQEIESQININLLGLIKFTQSCLPHISETIINIGSSAAKRGRAGHTVYSASKFGVRGFTQALAQECRDLKIYCVNPDPTATKITDFNGRPVAEVAQVIFNTVEGKYSLLSGSDVDVWEVLPD